MDGPPIDEKVKLRTELLSNKLSTGMRSRIRLSEMDLKTVLHHGTIMVEKFYVEQGSDFVKIKSLFLSDFSERNWLKRSWAILQNFNSWRIKLAKLVKLYIIYPILILLHIYSPILWIKIYNLYLVTHLEFAVNAVNSSSKFGVQFG